MKSSSHVPVALVLALVAACGPRPASGPENAAGPAIRVVGTAQDGGIPHAACACPRCEAARSDPTRRRRVASLAIEFPEEKKVFLVDATPDLREQLEALRDVRDAPAGRVDREPVDGVLLTHAHMGHYTGLAFFGFEAVSTRDLPVFCTPRMAAFLRGSGPWDQLVRIGNLSLHEVAPGTTLDLHGGVRVTALAVPHRDEYSDTVGYLLRGPRRVVLYVPDTDSWAAWPRPIVDVLEGVDVAILDGTFYSPDELPGRPVASIGHPLITVSMDLLEPIVRTGRTRVYFTHLNHSNPALEPSGPERREIEARGFRVLEEGERFSL